VRLFRLVGSFPARVTFPFRGLSSEGSLGGTFTPERRNHVYPHCHCNCSDAFCSCSLFTRAKREGCPSLGDRSGHRERPYVRLSAKKTQSSGCRVFVGSGDSIMVTVRIPDPWKGESGSAAIEKERYRQACQDTIFDRLSVDALVVFAPVKLPVCCEVSTYTETLIRELCVEVWADSSWSEVTW
jgi:hypothetical protein